MGVFRSETTSSRKTLLAIPLAIFFLHYAIMIEKGSLLATSFITRSRSITPNGTARSASMLTKPRKHVRVSLSVHAIEAAFYCLHTSQDVVHVVFLTAPRVLHALVLTRVRQRFPKLYITSWLRSSLGDASCYKASRRSAV